MHTQFLIFPPTKPPFPVTKSVKNASQSSLPAKARSARRAPLSRAVDAVELAKIFAGFRVAQVYVGHGSGPT